MHILIFLLFVLYPVQEVENVKLTFPSSQYEIFINYANDNFSQQLTLQNDMITADIKNANYLDLNLEFRVIPNRAYIDSLNPNVRELILDLFDGSESLKNYLTNVSIFLAGHISYSDQELPQDAAAVFFSRKANCVGYSNVVRVLLDAAGIKNETVKGFYLRKEKGNLLIPVPHRWVEITLEDNTKFFYDPQHQGFAVNYILTRGDVDFKQVKKFKVYMIDQSKKILN